MNGQITYAGFWKRFLAYLLDQLILGFIRIIIFIPFVLFGVLSYFPDFGNENFENFTSVGIQNYHDNDFSIAILSMLIIVILIFAFLNMIAEWLYYALMESSNKQATLGKMIVGIKVTDLSGNKITFGRATGRHFGKILSSLILSIGYLMAAFTEKKQALHDLIANCLVVNSMNI